MTEHEYIKARQIAFDLVWAQTNGEMRHSSPIPDNQPEWTHLMNVYIDMIKEGVTHYEALLASILHDVVEDYDVTVKDLAEMFNPEVAEIVSLVTKPKDFTDDMAAEYYNRILNSDNRFAMYIKVLDRIDNLLTDMVFKPNLGHVQEYLAETHRYILPMAKELGIGDKLQRAISYTDHFSVASLG
jgi:(p)ppGpp synthase/HD superfamily hydrolase